ncbi:MAG: NAD(P)H-hydrate dehydratase [Kiritimatiellae bacterium]|nr:NAD(P)H-hydrate dehydratase [Kiritimatiellia bacterium]
MHILPPASIAAAFPKRPTDLHKYSAGTVTVVGGSARYIHAPVIAALGARAAGAGLVQLVVPDASRIAAGALVPEATFTKQTPTCVPPRADVTVVGMGLGTAQNSEMLVSRILSGSSGRFVLDADALGILAKWYAARPRALAKVEGQTLVLTPHAGEAARLLACTPEDVQSDRPAAVRRIVERYSATVVLKGPHTLVAAPGRDEIFSCPAGNPFMALGGMGDLLSGALAARWAYLSKTRPDPDAAFLAACAAVWLHATASDALVNADPPGDPSVVNTAHALASLRVALEK